MISEYKVSLVCIHLLLKIAIQRMHYENKLSVTNDNIVIFLFNLNIDRVLKSIANE